jgi:hypothetical protein
MEGTKKVERKRKKTRPPRGAARRSSSPHAHAHSFEVRSQAVQLCLEGCVAKIEDGQGSASNGGGGCDFKR